MIKYILCTFLVISTSYASVGNIVDQILEPEESAAGEKRPCVVFNIDGTLCEKHSKAYQNQKGILNRFTDALVLPYLHTDRGLFKFIFYPEMMEVFLSTLQRGWNIAFFSSGIKDRNETVIKTYFKYMLKKYTDKPEVSLTSLLKTRRIQIFSRGDHVSGNDSKLAKYEYYGIKKKDLAALDLDVESSILFEDDRTYVMGAPQYPYVCTTLPECQKKFYDVFNDEFLYEASDAFKNFNPIEIWNPSTKTDVTTGQTYDDFVLPFGDRAAYFSGVLGLCADLMSSESINLRAALSTVLERRNYTDSDSDFNREEKGDTPWYLQHSGLDSLPRETYSAWIERGHKDIEAIKIQRLRDYVAPEDPFMSIGIDLYGDEFDPTKEGKDRCSVM